MSDLISRQDAIEAVCVDTCEHPYSECESKQDCTFVTRIKALPSTEAVWEWIPVSERLPEIGQKVLASTKGTVFTQVYKGIYSEPNVWHWNHNSIKVVTAWMPLPKPYREDGEE